jgi:NADH-quinone oxidoreductase subunit N
MFFATIPFLSFFVVLFKFCFFVFVDLMFLFREIFYIISILSMFFGSLFAIGKFQFKRMIAYSSIAHVGYFLICFTSLSILSFIYTLSYIIIYLLTSVLIFGLILNLPLQIKNTFSYLNNLNSFYLFSKFNLYISLIFIISLFSLIGIPPLPGFIVKLYVLTYLMEYKYYFISFIFICSSIFSSFYFLRIIKYIIFAVSSKSFRYLHLNTNNIDYLVLLTSYYLFFFSFLYIFYSDFILDFVSLSLLNFFL